MPRYKKPRRCRCPFKRLQGMVYKPLGIPLNKLELVPLYRDELEALRLCDKEDLTQEEAGKEMGISRGTVQRLLKTARRKIVISLTERKAIIFKKETNVKSLRDFLKLVIGGGLYGGEEICLYPNTLL